MTPRDTLNRTDFFVSRARYGRRSESESSPDELLELSLTTSWSAVVIFEPGEWVIETEGSLRGSQGQRITFPTIIIEASEDV